jgi:hypothetical protein
MRIRPGFWKFFVEFFVRVRLAMKVCGAIAGDGGEPTGKFGDFAQCVETRQGVEEDVLDQVVNIGVGDAGEKDAVDHARVAGVKEAKGGAVAALGGTDKSIVGAAVFRGRDHGCETGAGGAKFKECRHVGSTEMKIRLPV